MRRPSSVSLDCAAEAVELGGQGRQPVGLVAADVGDAAEPRRRVGERGEGGDDRGELADVVQVDVEAASWPRPADGEPGPVEAHLGAHRVEDVAERVTGLGGVLRPARHPHPAAGDQRRGEERRGVGQVGLDLDVEGVDLGRLDPPGVGVAVVDDDAGVAQRLDGHLDVRLARHRPAVVVHGDALVEAGAGEQQRGDELRGGRGVERHRAAGQPPGPSTVNGRRPRPSSSTGARGRAAPRAPAPWGAAGRAGRRRRRTGPSASAATGGRNRMTVPASPQSTVASPRSVAGRDEPVTASVVPSTSSTTAPRERSAWAISRVSRERSGRRSRDVRWPARRGRGSGW